MQESEHFRPKNRVTIDDLRLAVAALFSSNYNYLQNLNIGRSCNSQVVHGKPYVFDISEDNKVRHLYL